MEFKKLWYFYKINQRAYLKYKHLDYAKGRIDIIRELIKEAIWDIKISRAKNN